MKYILTKKGAQKRLSFPILPAIIIPTILPAIINLPPQPNPGKYKQNQPYNFIPFHNPKILQVG